MNQIVKTPEFEAKNTSNIGLNVNNINPNSQITEPSPPSNPNNKEFMKILILFIVLIALLAFLFILLFVILKVGKNKDKNKKGDNNNNGNNTDSKIPVIFDVDEGSDDMIAYTIANNSGKYDILGITTVCPAYYIEDVGNVWLKFLTYMDFNQKVYLGSDHPLVRKTEKYTFEYDYGIEFPETKKKPENEDAIDFMYNTIKNSKKKVTLFLLGPLTNFAKVIQRDSSIIDNIEEIIIMGGAKIEGNMDVNPKAEYNMYCDSEAANIVLNCGADIKMLGTDVTHKIDELFEKYKKMNTRSSTLLYNCMKGQLANYNNTYVHDPTTVLYHLNRDIVELNPYYVTVNTTNPDVMGTDYGTTEFIEPKNNNNKYNIYYSDSVVLEEYWEDLEKYMTKY